MQNFNSLSIYFIKYCCIMSLIMVVYYIMKLYFIIMFLNNKNYIIPIHYPNKIKNWLLDLKNSINLSTPHISATFNAKNIQLKGGACGPSEPGLEKREELVKKDKKISFFKFYLKLILLYSVIFIINFLILIYFF